MAAPEAARNQLPRTMAVTEPNTGRPAWAPRLDQAAAGRDGNFQPQFKVVKVADLDAGALDAYRKPPSEAMRQEFAKAAHTSPEAVGSLFLFEIPDCPIAREYQRWVGLHPTSMEDVGVSVISRRRFLQERGGEAVHKAVWSLVARGRPEHGGWLLYDTARQD